MFKIEERIEFYYKWCFNRSLIDSMKWLVVMGGLVLMGGIFIVYLIKFVFV